MPKKVNPLAVASKAIDPILNALFAASAGPVQAPPKSLYAAVNEDNLSKPNGRDDDQSDDEELSQTDEELSYGEDEDEDDKDDSETSKQHDEDNGKQKVDGSSDNKDVMSVTEELVSEEEQQARDVVAATEAAAAAIKKKRDRKRKRKNENDDLEEKYLAKLTKDEDSEPLGKRQKGGEKQSSEGEEDVGLPAHESLAQDKAKSDTEKASRTVFLANVSSAAISSKSAKKELIGHLSSVLDKEASPPQKIESFRFRSVAFSTGSMPKRAAYITHSVMDTTTKSTNAYVVYSSSAAARKVAAELNGSEILGRHIRVDSVAHPSPMDNRRCVFVGNLGFIDDETVLDQKADGKTVERKRNKIPSDVEEGLWRTFGTQGKIENVRVVRDPKTRVGKGFAYVQFYDGNDVESALLLNGKKFPPMLPRALRVTRAKDPRKTAQALERDRAKADAINGTRRNLKYRPKATSEEQAAAGRAGKLLGRSGAAMLRKGPRHSSKDGEFLGTIKNPEDIIFEGRRASARDALPKDLKGKKGKGKGGKSARPKNRSARRAATWKQKK